MEQTQLILSHIKSLQFDSEHKDRIDEVLSYHDFLIFVVNEYLNSQKEKLSPLAQRIRFSILNEKFIGRKTLLQISDLISYGIGNLSEADFKDVAQSLLRECLKEIRRSNDFFTSPQVNEIIVQLIKPKQNQIIYDPTCGIGSTFVEIHKKYPNLNLKFVGQEINYLTQILCQINLFINGIQDAEIYHSNSIDNLPIKYRGKVNIAVCDPPFINRNERFEINDFIENILLMVNAEGRFIIVVPDTFLNLSSYERFRKDYLQKDLIEEIISLPESVNSRIGLKTSVVVFNSHKTNKRSIYFDGIDFRNISKFVKTKVPLDSIHETDLRANRYALKSVKELNSLLSNANLPVVRIEELISFSKLGRHYRHNEIKSGLKEVPLVRAIDLPKEGENSNLDISKLERKVIPFSERAKIDFPAVMVSLIGNKLKPTIFNFDGQTVAISSDIVAFKLKQNVDVDYFLFQLNSEYVKTQIESVTSGSTIRRILVKDFLNIRIILPSLNEQKRRAVESLKQIQKELYQDITEEKKEARLAEYDIIRITVHDLNHKLGAMQNDLNALKKFFENDLSDYLHQPIKPVFEEDTEEEINQLRLGNILQRLINTRNEASAQLAATREELQNNTVSPTRANFRKWLESVKLLYENKIDFTVEGESISLDFDQNRFKNLVRNLVENAIQFNAKKVVFDLSYVYFGDKKQDKENVRILYKNDGDRFPEDFDFDTHFKGLYQKSSKSKGTGIGGYSINRTVELHNGELNNISPEKEAFDLFPVQIEIILPIEYKPNQNYVKSNPYTID